MAKKNKKDRKLKKLFRKMKDRKVKTLEKFISNAVYSGFMKQLSGLSIEPQYHAYDTFKEFEDEIKLKMINDGITGPYISNAIRNIIAPRMYGGYIDEKNYPVHIDLMLIGEDDEENIKTFIYQVIIDLSAKGTKDIIFQVAVDYNVDAKPGDWLYKFIGTEDPTECYYGEDVKPIFTIYTPVKE